LIEENTTEMVKSCQMNFSNLLALQK